MNREIHPIVGFSLIALAMALTFGGIATARNIDRNYRIADCLHQGIDPGQCYETPASF